MQRLAQYMARPSISLSKVVLEERGGKVLFHTRYNPYFKENLKLFAVTDFIAEITAHIPPKGTHYFRRYGLYASRTRGTWSRKPHLVRLAGSAWRAAHPVRRGTPLSVCLCSRRPPRTSYAHSSTISARLTPHNPWSSPT